MSARRNGKDGNIAFDEHSSIERRMLLWALAINVGRCSLPEQRALLPIPLTLLGAALDNLGDTAVYVASLHAVGRWVKTKSSTARLSGVLLIGLGLALLGEVPAICGRTRADRLGHDRHGYCKCCK